MKYGPIQPPEQQAHIEVANEPVKFVQETYSLFKKTTAHLNPNHRNPALHPEIVEAMYHEAEKLVCGHENVKPSWKDVRAVYLPTASEHDGTGLYLSALLNHTSLEEIIIGNERVRLGVVGYRMKKGKRLVNTCTENYPYIALGEYCEGDVFNFGNARAVGMKAEGGFQGNWGEVIDGFGSNAAGGMQVNYGQAAPEADPTVFFNEGCRWFGYEAIGGIQAEWSPHNHMTRRHNSEGIHLRGTKNCSIRHGDYTIIPRTSQADIGQADGTAPIKKYYDQIEHAMTVGGNRQPEIAALVRKLRRTVKPLFKLKQFSKATIEDLPAIIEFVKKYDFAAIEKTARETAQEIIERSR